MDVMSSLLVYTSYLPIQEQAQTISPTTLPLSKQFTSYIVLLRPRRPRSLVVSRPDTPYYQLIAPHNVHHTGG